MSINNKAIILLSGGLDSSVSIAESSSLDFKLALTFDYGQKSFQKEFKASQNLAQYYGIEHKIIKLEWLANITNTSLVSQKDIPVLSQETLNDKNVIQESMQNVWVPNRNGLFINIAAAFADSYKFDYIVIGANKEEAATFSDNSKTFITDINKALETSTHYNVKVIAPLIDFDKYEIVKKAIELNVPLHLINSCYNNTPKHCGKCESCNRLKRALAHNGYSNIIKELFE